MSPSTAHASLVTPFGKRAETAVHPLTAHLYRLMEAKQSNLCLSADVSTVRELLTLADRVGPAIVVLKTHYDLVSGWDYHPQTGTGAQLAALARKHGFLLFEDRKFADIGKTVQQQYTAGTARIIDWAHMVTVNMDAGAAAVTALQDAADHWRSRVNYEVKTLVTVGTPVEEEDDDDVEEHEGEKQTKKTTETNEACHAPPPPPPGRKGSTVSITTVTKQSYEPAAEKDDKTSTITTAKAISLPECPTERGILLLAQMSSKGNLMTPAYTQACVEAARAHPKFVLGFIAQETLNTRADDTFVILTPGCKLPPAEEDLSDDDDDDNGGDKAKQLAGDGMGQQYNTPAKLIGQCGTDIVIVGRGIITAADPPSEAKRYQKKAWKAYKARLGQ